MQKNKTIVILRERTLRTKDLCIWEASVRLFGNAWVLRSQRTLSQDDRMEKKTWGQSSRTRKIEPCAVCVSRATSSARLRSSFWTRTRTHQSPAGLLKLKTLAVR
jgi:hypothetical protein